MSTSASQQVEIGPAHAERSDAVKVLLEASTLLLAGADLQGVLSGIVELARNIIAADAYAVWRSYDGTHWRAVASYGLSASFRSEFRRDTPVRPQFQAITDVFVEPSLSEHRDAYRRESISSILVVPLQLHDPGPERLNCGTVTFYWRMPRTFSEFDLASTSALANLSAAALNLSELHQQNQREKARLAFLAEASAVLASSLDYETTLQQVARLAVKEIADWCSVHIVENGLPTRLVVAHADPSQLTLAQEYSRRYPEQIVPERGLGKVLATRKSEVYSQITPEMLAAAAVDAEHLEMLQKLRLTGSILVPLLGHDDTVLGAIRILSTGDRLFQDDDVSLAEDLARRAATAIENAQLHSAVLEQEKNLRLAHATGRMGSWSWDLVRDRLYWSDEFKALHGIASDTQGRYESGVELIHPEDREAIVAQVAVALASADDHLVMDHRNVTMDGGILWINSRGRIDRDPAGRALTITGISIDVTERRNTEEAMRKSEKLAAAGRLAATVAHEINNPLESIVNLVYLSRQTPGVPPEAAEYLATADEELTRIAQIVRQTLGFYRESVDPRESDIGRLVGESCNIYLRRMHARSIECDLDLETGVKACVIPGELKQVVANLVANAIDATEGGGRIRVSARSAKDKVEITVSDTGSGIEEANLSRLFEPFFTTKPEIGTGLGLWVTKGIVDKQEGSISIRSSTDSVVHGTAVTVTLPRV